MVRSVTNRRAFTLVEILVVIIILAALALIALPSLLGQRDKAKDSQTRANITNTYKALKAEYATGELYSTATVTSAIAGEPNLPIVMVTGGADFAYPSGKIEVSLINSQTVLVAGKAASGKTFLLAAKEQGDSAGVVHAAQTNKFLPLSPATNLLTYPDAEGGGSPPNGWYPEIGSTITSTTSWAKRGKTSTHVTATFTPTSTQAGVYTGIGGAATPGTTYTTSVWVNLTTLPAGATAILSVEWWDCCGNGISSSYSQPISTTGVHQFVVTGVAPAGTTHSSPVVWVNRGGTDGPVAFDVDSFSFVQGNLPGDFDGDSPGGTWTGTPHASISTGYIDKAW